MLQYFMKQWTAGARNEYLSLKSRSLQYIVKGGVLTTYSKVENYVLKMYTTDFTTAKTDSENAHYVKSPTPSQLEFVSTHWLKPLRCPHSYDELVFEWSSVKDYGSPLGTICEHAEVGTRQHRLRRWRITPICSRNCKR